MRYTYSRWDGTQGSEGVDADQLMAALSDELMADGNLDGALQRVVRWGLTADEEHRLMGMQHLLQQLRDQRQAELQRYNLDSILDNLKDRVADVVESERAGIDRRLQPGPEERPPGIMLDSIVERKRSFLDKLSEEPGSAVTSLSDYEFLSEEAREKFHALTEMLERHVLQRHFQSMERMLGRLSGDELHGVTTMLHDLNELLEAYGTGQTADLAPFMDRHGEHFPDVSSVDDLIGQMQEQASHTEALMASMSPDMRRRLDEMMRRVLADHALREQLGRITETLQAIGKPQTPDRDYPFSGEQSLTLEEALRLMRRMHDLDELEEEMGRAHQTGDAGLVDSELVQKVMGERARNAVEQLAGLVDVLEEAGYVQTDGESIQLTSRGIRTIGYRALQDIFSHLKRGSFGEHATTLRGAGGDRAEETKRYEFGDQFLLDLHGTLMNAVERTGADTPLKLAVPDFEVFHTERMSQAATVLMLDMSRSMPLRGCFAAAKKVALALNSLIRLQYPRDHLYIVGFSDFARQLRPENLHQVTWGDYVYGTNMQHGLMVARRLLGRHASGTKQVILITDGEPTAHFEGGRIQFAYPPTFRTFQETLREVKRCTQEGIVINTFMLERSHYLADFVTQMTRINRGRAFFATPERLGDYVLVDYLHSRQTLARRV